MAATGFYLSAMISATLACLQLDTLAIAQSERTVIPQSQDLLSELFSCWKGPAASIRPASDEHTLAAMEDPGAVELLHMPAVDSPDCSLGLAQCRITDDYICKAYGAGARVSGLGNMPTC